MTLTEEQREALSNALDYIRETKLPISGICEYDIAVIRAMIDSSEDADYENLRCENCGKTLKEIRGSKYAGDYCLGEIRIDPGQEASWSDPPIEQSYYFWCDECKNDSSERTKMIAEIERLRAGHCADCCCARSWEALGISEYTGKSIPEEITHLQEWVIKNRDIATDLQYQLDDEVKENERLLASLVEHEEHENQTHAILGAILGTDDTLENVAKRAMARIAELEKWLKKERSARLLEQSSSIRLAYLVENKIDFDEFFDGKALEQLQTEGKIGNHIVGPDQMVPNGKCWQITEEREAAVDFAIEYISANDSNDPGICFCVASLRAMLTEAE